MVSPGNQKLCFHKGSSYPPAARFCNLLFLLRSSTGLDHILFKALRLASCILIVGLGVTFFGFCRTITYINCDTINHSFLRLPAFIITQMYTAHPPQKTVSCQYACTELFVFYFHPNITKAIGESASQVLFLAPSLSAPAKVRRVLKCMFIAAAVPEKTAQRSKYPVIKPSQNQN